MQYWFQFLSASIFLTQDFTFVENWRRVRGKYNPKFEISQENKVSEIFVEELFSRLELRKQQL